MRKALLRFEDVGPGGHYASFEALQKLKVIMDYLHSQGIPFHISVIPRFVNPHTGYDRSITLSYDPYIRLFNQTIQYKMDDSCRLGMHGYTHQYAESVSGDGFEFTYSSCRSNCPPDDLPAACSREDDFVHSYAYQRLRAGYQAFQQSGVKLGWGFSAPHYTASPTQRSIIEAWFGLIYENPPDDPETRCAAIYDKDSPFYRGVIYVPTPLYYIGPDRAVSDLKRICRDIKEYRDDELASVFYHPHLEFPFIQIVKGGTVIYNDNSYLKQLIRCFRKEGFEFVPVLSLFNFVPASRKTDFYPGLENVIFTGDIDGTGKTGLIIWQPASGTWFLESCPLENFPCRQVNMPDLFTTSSSALNNWAVGEEWKPLIGDFNGDGIDDVVVWDYQTGGWQVALNTGKLLIPDPGRGDFHWLRLWASGNHWVPLVGDFNGDGLDDILVWEPGDGVWQAALSDGSQFVPSPGRGDYLWLQPWAVGSGWTPLIGDFNGDGKSDIAVWNSDIGEWQVAVSDGTQFVPHPDSGNFIWLQNWGVGPGWKARVGDFNGDGYDDILVVDPEKGAWQVALSTGHSFRPLDNSFQPWAADANMQPYTGDFNGDGTCAILARHPFLRNGTLDAAVSVISRRGT